MTSRLSALSLPRLRLRGGAPEERRVEALDGGERGREARALLPFLPLGVLIVLLAVCLKRALSHQFVPHNDAGYIVNSSRISMNK